MTHVATKTLSARDWFRRGSQAVSVEPRAPQDRFPLHDHEFGEVVIVVSGNGWHILNDEPQLITSGEVFYIRPEDRHAFEQVHDLCLTNVLYRPSERLLSRERIQQLLENPEGRRRWQLTEESLRAITPLLTQLDLEVRSDDPHSDVMAESLFIQLAVALCRHRIPLDCDELPAQGAFGHVLAYLRRHFTSDLDVADVARRSGFSLRTFTRLFRKATATTPHDYVVKLRIGSAMHAIRTTCDSITDIAFASGFNDSNYFSSCFSKMTGCSPSEYRRRAQEAGAVAVQRRKPS